MTRPGPPIRLVTVSREFGSGGSELARSLGRRLEWRVADRDVVARVAEELRVPEREVEASDGHVAGLAERVGRYLSGSFPEVVFPVQDPPLDEEEVARLAEAVVRECAAQPRVVVVGHAGMCLFAHRRDALHIRVVAPLAYRVAEVMRRLDVPEAEAREEIRTRDDEREAYIRQRHRVAWQDPGLYGLVLNSAEIGPEDGAAMVAALIAAREESGAAGA